MNPPVQPHHRGSTCPNKPAACGWDNNVANNQPNPQSLDGALVGGPRGSNDAYTDDRLDYTANEVTLDYNAGFQALVAGLKTRYC